MNSNKFFQFFDNIHYSQNDDRFAHFDNFAIFYGLINPYLDHIKSIDIESKEENSMTYSINTDDENIADSISLSLIGSTACLYGHKYRIYRTYADRYKVSVSLLRMD